MKFIKLLELLRPQGQTIILSEYEAKKKIAKWRKILKTQDEAMDRLEKGLKLGQVWLVDLPARITLTKEEVAKLKKNLKEAGSEQAFLVLGKKILSKDRLLKQLIVTQKAMVGNLKLVELQHQRLEDRAVELATKIQESEIYLSLAGSLEVARNYIQEIEQPISQDATENLISFKSLVMGIDKDDEISDDDVKTIFRKEYENVGRKNRPVVKTVRKTKRAKASNKAKRV